MAIFKQEQEQIPSLFDVLYCEEEKWEDDDEQNNEENNDVLLLEQDMFWEDEELQSLFAKEIKQGVLIKDSSSLSSPVTPLCWDPSRDPRLAGTSSCVRKESVEWMLKVNSHYGFCVLTSILSVNYFDRCISSVPFIQNAYNKPWTIQLLALACLSLAAKVEETNVPFLLDLQVEGARPIFEARDVQKMELLVLSTLEWKMHPITPISFVDHIIRRLGLKINIHWEFLKRCEIVLLSLLSDWRFGSYLPSVLAAATMMHVIDQIEPFDPLDHQTQLLNVLNFSKEKVRECYELILEKSSGSNKFDIHKSKRKNDQIMMNNSTSSTTIPSSPSGVMDACWFSSDSSNDSWPLARDSNVTSGQLSVSTSVPSSPVRNVKRGRVHEQLMPLQLPSLCKSFYGPC